MILLIFFLFLFILSCTLLYILFYTIIPQISGTKPDFFSQDDTDFLKLPAVNTPFNHDKKRALVFCSPDKKFSLRRFIYAGHKDCNLFKTLYEAEYDCSLGCIGFGSCISHCPQDAIIIKNNTAVITESCNGCGKCIPHCPNNLIKLVPAAQDFVVQCSSHDGKNTSCSEACTACGSCLDPYIYSGFSIVNNLAVSDYKPNHDKSGFAAKCPSKTIKNMELTEKNDFKFWKLCYNILHKSQDSGESEIWE